MSDYTPTTQQVEDGFVHEPEYEYHNPVNYGAYVQSNRRAFRRWLAEYTRVKQAEALEEAASSPIPREALTNGTRAWLRARATEYRKGEER